MESRRQKDYSEEDVLIDKQEGKSAPFSHTVIHNLQMIFLKQTALRSMKSNR